MIIDECRFYGTKQVDENRFTGMLWLGCQDYPNYQRVKHIKSSNFSWFNHQISNCCSVPLKADAWTRAVAWHIHQAVNVAGEVEQWLGTWAMGDL